MKNLLFIMLLISFTVNSQVEGLLKIAQSSPPSSNYVYKKPLWKTTNTNSTIKVDEDIQAFPLVLDGVTIYSEGVIDIFNDNLFSPITNYTIYDDIGVLKTAEFGTNIINTHDFFNNRIYTVEANVGDNKTTFRFKKD